MNKSDAERAAAILEKMGYRATDSEESADLIMVVACSVRQSAVDRVYGKAKNWQSMKEKKPLITILTGCVLAKDKKKLAPFFDLIFPVGDLIKLPQKLDKLPASQITDYLAIHPHYENNFQAYVPIATGCNNFCAYCVVPYVRGHEICRPAEDIISEVESLIKAGYKEITLLGQNVNSYHSQACPRPSAKRHLQKLIPKTDGRCDISFPKLLKIIDDLPGDFWLRFITSHPKDLSDELIEVMADSKRICEYLHLPIQSGDNEILARMNRGYTAEHYKKIIAKIRQKMPRIAISTDVIVGFPGETEEHFENTAQLMKDVKFDMAYIAEYSP